MKQKIWTQRPNTEEWSCVKAAWSFLSTIQKMSVTTQGPLRASKKHSNTTPSASKSAIVSLFCKPRETQESGRWGFPSLSSALTRPALWVSTLCSCSFSLNSVTLLSLTLAPSLCPQPHSHRPAGECAPLSQMQAGRGPCLVPLL